MAKVKTVKIKVPKGDWIDFSDQLPEEGERVKVIVMMEMVFEGLKGNKGAWGFRSDTSPKCVIAWEPLEEDEDAEVQSSSGSGLVAANEGSLEFDCPGSGED